MIDFKPFERPYPGLRAFEPHEAEIFFGREAHTDQLLAILQRERFLAVVGPSGVGKSSLVCAGLLPWLSMGSLGTGSDWRIVRVRPGTGPMRNLARSLLQREVLGDLLSSRIERDQKNEPTGPVESEIAALEAELRRGPLSLASLVDVAQERHRVANSQVDPSDPSRTDSAATQRRFNLLVFVDQFEEIFTYADASGRQADECDAFVSLLLAARDAAQADIKQPGIHITLTIRTDYLGDCVRFPELPDVLNRASYLFPRLTRDEIQHAICAPAELWGGNVEEALVLNLANATEQNADQLPIIQHAMSRIWMKAIARNPAKIFLDQQTLEDIGGVNEAVLRHSMELLGELSPSDRNIAVGIFCAITKVRPADLGGSFATNPQSVEKIAEWLGISLDSVIGLVKRLSEKEACFLHCDGPLGPECIVELAHESLLRQWAQLRTWIVEENERAERYRYLRSRFEAYILGRGKLLIDSDLMAAKLWIGWGMRKDTIHQTSNYFPSPTWALRYSSLCSDHEWSTKPRNLRGAMLLGVNLKVL